MAPFLVELETMNTLEFYVVTTVGVNNLTTNTKCYIKDAGKKGKEITPAQRHDKPAKPSVAGGGADRVLQTVCPFCPSALRCASLATGCIFFSINLPAPQTPVSHVSLM